MLSTLHEDDAVDPVIKENKIPEVVTFHTVKKSAVDVVDRIQ